MVKRIGSPSKVRAIKFDRKGAQEIICPKCQANTGIHSAGGVIRISGGKDIIPTRGFKARCPKCREELDV